jgi:PEP-CTERM motif
MKRRRIGTRLAHLWLALACGLVPASLARGQGTIVYVHAPLSNPNGDPNHLPWDSLGTQVGPAFPVVINGQTVLTFSTPIVAGQPSEFNTQPSSTSAIIGHQPYSDFPDNVWVVPLSAGQEIGPDAASCNWLRGDGNCLLTAARDSHTIGEPPLTVGYFTGLESAYLGFQFQQNSETHYGWVRLGCPIAELNVGWIYDYAYELLPGASILAGAVPEPSTWALLSAGGILFGLLGRGKRMA